MSTPYNDQWVLRRAGRGRPRRLGPAGHASGREQRSGEPQDPGAARAMPGAVRAIGRLGKRPQWIDRDT
jgi:hypothetical protein